MEQFPHYYSKLFALQALAKRREVIILLNRETIDLKGMLWKGIEDVIVLRFVFRFVILYGLVASSRNLSMRWLPFRTGYTRCKIRSIKYGINQV
jgi:hypothetical protein